MATGPSTPLCTSTATLEGAVHTLLHRAADHYRDPRERVHCALAAARADPPSATLRCRAHLMAGSLLHEFVEDESSRVAQHLRTALGLCGPPAEPILRVAVVCMAMRVSRSLLRSGELVDARPLLETLLGAMQAPTMAAESTPPALDAALQHLGAHAALLFLSLMHREGHTGEQAQRQLAKVRSLVQALPPPPETLPLDGVSAAARGGGQADRAAATPARWSSCTTLRQLCDLHRGLLLMHQGELREGGKALDALIAETAEASSAWQACTDLRPDTMAAAALATEARLLRALIHVAQCEFEGAFSVAEEVRTPSAMPPSAPPAMPLRIPSAMPLCALPAMPLCVLPAMPLLRAASSRKIESHQVPKCGMVFRARAVQVRAALCGSPSASASSALAGDPGGTEGDMPSRAHGPASYSLLLAHAALTLEQPETAATLVERARQQAGGGHAVALGSWIELLHVLLAPASASERLGALRGLALTDDAKAHRQLRGALQLAQGEASLMAGEPAEAEKRLARSVKLSVGDYRCDALTAHALMGCAAAMGASADAASDGGASATASASAAAPDAPDAAGGPSGEEAPAGGGKSKRRREDSLSSALMLSAGSHDLHAQKRALQGWVAHYRETGELQQQQQFAEMLDGFKGKLSRKLAKARQSGALERLASA